jgi:hypothetical protein
VTVLVRLLPALAIAGAVLALSARPAVAQTCYESGGRLEPNIPYDGRFIFARIRYAEFGFGGGGGFRGRGNSSRGWSFDYPCTEINFGVILSELTTMQPYMDGGNVYDFDDPELFKFPVAYVSEPGYWYPSASEAEGLRNYLAKGGFVIFDDFRFAQEWMVFERGLRMALPDVKIFPMDASHPIFDAFFRIPALDMTYPNDPSVQAEFYGIYEDNDPKKRLISIINYNNDIGDYIEHSGQGRYPINLTNEAYKYALNYIVYALTR